MVMVPARGITGGISIGVWYLGTVAGSSDAARDLCRCDRHLERHAADLTDEEQPGAGATADAQEIPPGHPCRRHGAHLPMSALAPVNRELLSTKSYIPRRRRARGRDGY